MKELKEPNSFACRISLAFFTDINFFTNPPRTLPLLPSYRYSSVDSVDVSLTACPRVWT